jgi:hypothetical protein
LHLTDTDCLLPCQYYCIATILGTDKSHRSSPRKSEPSRSAPPPPPHPFPPAQQHSHHPTLGEVKREGCIWHCGFPLLPCRISMQAAKQVHRQSGGTAAHRSGVPTRDKAMSHPVEAGLDVAVSLFRPLLRFFRNHPAKQAVSYAPPPTHCRGPATAAAAGAAQTAVPGATRPGRRNTTTRAHAV